MEIDSLDNILRGKGLYPHIEEQIKGIYRYQVKRHHQMIAKENKMKLSDWLIINCTKEIANTEIGRKIFRDKIIKPYPKDAEKIRVLLK